MKNLLIALFLIALTGCASTGRLGEYHNNWYIVGTNDDIEVQANHVPGELDVWYIQLTNLGETEYDVMVTWRTIDYKNYVAKGWVRMRARETRYIGHFQQDIWKLDGVEIPLGDATIKVDSIEVEEVTR